MSLTQKCTVSIPLLGVGGLSSDGVLFSGVGSESATMASSVQVIKETKTKTDL